MSGFAVSKLATVNFHQRLHECESNCIWPWNKAMTHKPAANLQNNVWKSKNEELTKDKQMLRNEPTGIAVLARIRSRQYTEDCSFS